MLQRVILHAAREVSGKRYWRIEFFNDDPHTTHADVLEVLHRARENIIAGMICEPQSWHRRWVRGLRSLIHRVPDVGTARYSAPVGPYSPVGTPSAVSESSPAYACGDRDTRREREAVLELTG
ncbi:MAG: hypothetical protein J2P48_14070 [Alphaproteobacteria bacterium]|nr:hypothetical protein [Alphaproteobacteria bacterium]